MEAHVYKKGQYGLRVEFCNMLKWPSDRIHLFRKINSFVRAHTIYDIVHATLKIAREMWDLFVFSIRLEFENG